MSTPQPYPQQPYQPPAPAPAKKKRKWPWIVGGVIVVIVVIAIASGGGSTTPGSTGVPAGSDTSQQQAPAQAAGHTVVYTVAGSGKASSITYTTDGMTTTNQESNVALPWSKKLSLPAGEAIQLVQVLAQGSGKGTIDVTIEVDGKKVKEAHADGYGVASANANIGSLGS